MILVLNLKIIFQKRAKQNKPINELGMYYMVLKVVL